MYIYFFLIALKYKS